MTVYVRRLADLVLEGLPELGAYEYARSARGNSIYIKFSNPKLGSLRISDHTGRQKYRYKWNLRVDEDTRVEEDQGVKRFYYNFREGHDLLRHIRNYERKINGQ